MLTIPFFTVPFVTEVTVGALGFVTDFTAAPAGVAKVAIRSNETGETIRFMLQEYNALFKPIAYQNKGPLVSQEAFVFVAYLLLAAAACASATFTYIAGTCWAHLDATGHAKWCI
jgi:hypothetical protein